MDDDDGQLKYFTEQGRFFDVLAYLLRQIDGQPQSSELVDSLPGAFSNNPLGYLNSILDRYQEQPYLLDPHLEPMIQPIVLSLRTWLEYLLQNSHHLENPSTDSIDVLDLQLLSSKLNQISRLLYFIIKVRGYKTIVRFFPHQVHDLSMVTSAFGLVLREPVGQSSKIVVTFMSSDLWPLRYILLLWLSLICMLPFDLSQFDRIPTLEAQNIRTRDYIEKIGWSYLGFPGKERESAALVLARLMLREDVFQSHLPSFVNKCLELLQTAGQHDVFLATGIVQVLCIIVELARPAQLLNVLPSIHQAIMATHSLPYISASINLRKLRTKLVGRVALIIPFNSLNPNSPVGGEAQMPESMEAAIEELLTCLQDKDTVVRWSGAKYLAKIGKRLPDTYSVQICDAILELFSLKTIEEQQGRIDLLSVNDHTWQGACLACAELMRQKCFPTSRLKVLIEWIVRALHFEQRKGAQSIGSGVRDAASYVLWSFGRAFSSNDVEPFAHQLAVQLVLQTLFDREVHVRRAGSAAFQENVGRLGVFPHGIEVLQRADFFTVGLKRSAFLKAAPDVARLEEYREAILNHLLEVCIGHWDHGIRELASQSVCQITRSAFDKPPYSLLCRLELNLLSKDINQVHGALLTLGELAKAAQDEKSLKENTELLDKIFQLVTGVLGFNLPIRQLGTLAIAICEALAYTLPARAESCEQFIESPGWTQLVQTCLKRPDDDLHHSLQHVLHRVSLRDIGEGQLKFFSKTLQRGLPIARQASARCLGGFAFRTEAFQPHFKSTFNLLATYAASKSKGPTVPIELTRNSLESLVSIVVNLGDQCQSICTSEQFSSLLTVAFDGLNNYTNDHRGDVGSWVRASSLRSLEKVIEYYVQSSQPLSSIATYTNSHHVEERHVPIKSPGLDPQFLLDFVFRGILRQTLESIDSVRELAWATMSRVLVLLSDSNLAEIDKTLFSFLKSTFDPKSLERWRELQWTFPNSLDLLTNLINLALTLTNTENPEDGNYSLSPSSSVDLLRNLTSFSDPLLEGTIILICGKGNSDSKKAAATFTSKLGSLGKSNNYALEEIVKRILKLARTQPSGSKNFGLCCWDAICLLLESNALGSLGNYENGHKLLQHILAAVTRGTHQPKVSLNRVLTGSKIVIHLMAFKVTQIEAADHLKSYLAHSSPRVRTQAAEALLNKLQLQNDKILEAKRLLSEREWSQLEIGEATEIAQQIITSVKEAWKKPNDLPCC